MHYEEFYWRFTKPFRLRIIGWPTGIDFVRPGMLRTPKARRLLRYWEEGRIQIVKVSKEEVQALGVGLTPLVRQVRRDKGRQRVGVLTPETVASEDDMDSEEETEKGKKEEEPISDFSTDLY